jgi:hypothetical protein
MADTNLPVDDRSEQAPSPDKSTEGLIFVPDGPGGPVPRRGRRRPAIAYRKPPTQSSEAKEPPPPASKPTDDTSNRRSTPIDKELFNQLAEDRSDDCVQNLIAVSRGVALILESMWENMKDKREQPVVMGLAAALFNAVDPADAYFFASAGELNERRIHPAHRIYLLEKELEKARKANSSEEES